MKLSEIAKLIGGKLNGNPDIEIDKIARIEEALTGDITWISHPRYERWINETQASCLIVGKGKHIKGVPTISVKNPLLAISKLLQTMNPEIVPEKCISELSQIDKSTKIGKGVSIGAFTWIGKNSIIGDGVIIYPRVYIGNRVTIGGQTRIYSNATIEDRVIIGERVLIKNGAVIGTDGFAYTKVAGKYKPIPHRGGVILEDEVEIGALSTVARSVIGNTILKRGTKIDNLVHIAHNVVIGENSIIAAQTGVAGSVEIGKDVVFAGQVGIADHIKIGDGAVVAAKSGVAGNIPRGITVMGYPAKTYEKARKTYALLFQLPELFKRLKELEHQCKTR